MAGLNFGTTIQLGNGDFGRLGAYPKDPTYVVLGSESGSTVAVYQNWRLDYAKKNHETDQFELDTSYKGPVKYGQGFFLYNVSANVSLWMSDDKTSSGFDGQDGYFGFTKIPRACVCTLSGQPEGTPVNFGDTEVTLNVHFSRWHAQGKTLTVYPKNNWNYLVWDEPEYANAQFSIDTSS